MGKPRPTCGYARQSTFKCILPPGHTQPCAGYLPNDTLWARVVTATTPRKATR